MMNNAYGRYWRLDSDGYIENDAGRALISAGFSPVVDAAVSVYRTLLGTKLHSIYLRGSVPRGLAISGVSDLDTLALTLGRPGEAQDESFVAAEANLLSDFPFITGVQFEHHPVPPLAGRGTVQELLFVLKTQSVCVFGQDVTPDLPGYRPDATAANIDIIQIEEDIREARQALDECDSGALTRNWASRIAKNMIRTGFALTLTDQGRYTRDLALCVDCFNACYPDRSRDMTAVLKLALRPPETAQPILRQLDGLGRWMIAEADRWLGEHNPERLHAMKLAP